MIRKTSVRKRSDDRDSTEVFFCFFLLFSFFYGFPVQPEYGGSVLLFPRYSAAIRSCEIYTTRIAATATTTRLFSE